MTTSDWQRETNKFLEAGLWEQAIKICRQQIRKMPDNPEPQIWLAEILQDAGDWATAAETWQQIRQRMPDSAEFAARSAWCAFEQGQFSQAEKEALAALRLQAEVPLAHHVLARLREREGMTEEAERHDRAAWNEDPEGYPLPITLTDDFCRTTVRQAVEQLPEEYRQLLETVPVLVEKYPSIGLLKEGEISATVLGAYIGVPIVERSYGMEPSLPDRIHIFSRNVARSCSSLEEAREELQITIWHEIAHHLGFSEEDMNRLGLD